MKKELNSLSIEEKVGQLFFIGLPTAQNDSKTNHLLTRISPGGICLFARNIQNGEQTRNYLDAIRKVASIEPLFSIDQEGGLVDRLRRIMTPILSAASIKTVADAENLANITAEVIRMFGFNMNFAPVVDIMDENRAKYSNGLYSRVFGNSKESAAQLAGAYLNALQNKGCLGCIKHFPGLGASRTDSHDDLPIVDLNRLDLFAVDLYPYQMLFKTKQVHSVMVGHASYPHFDLQESDANGKLLPSSLSFKIINNLLRGELNFQGLVISDDLEMGAILKNYSIGEACIMAINAGADMISICANSDAIEEGFEAVLDSVKTGKIKESRINESFERIGKMKSLIQAPLPFDMDRLQILNRQTAELNKKVNYNYGG